jgi:hypothetical protein
MKPLILTSGHDLLFEDMEIGGGIGAALGINGTAERVTLRRCLIHAGEGKLTCAAKISAPDVTLEDCELVGGTSHGLYLFSYPTGGVNGGPRIPHRFTMRRCSFADAGKWAIHLNDEGNGCVPKDLLFEDCSVTNSRDGMVIAMGLGVTVRRLSVDGGATGMWLGYQPSSRVLVDGLTVMKAQRALMLDGGKSPGFTLRGFAPVDCVTDLLVK